MADRRSNFAPRELAQGSALRFTALTAGQFLRLGDEVFAIKQKAHPQRHAQALR